VLVSLDGETQFPLPHRGEVTGIAFDADSKFVATAGLNGFISLWDTTNGEKQPSIMDNSEPVYSLAFSPKGKLAAAGLHNKTKIWDLTTHEPLRDLTQKGDIISVIFSQDGNWLATGSAEGTVLLWRVEGASFNQRGGPLRLNGRPQILSFSPDNRWLVGGSSSGFANLWDTATVQEVARIPHNDPVTGVSFSLDGLQLLTVSRKVVRIWNVAAIPLIPQDQLITSACSHLTNNLSQDNWASFFGDEEYRLLCPDLPEEK
jgi:WD40 repeat protein